MSDTRLYRGLALFNISITLLFIADTFVSTPHVHQEIVVFYSSVETRDINVPSHWTHFIHTKSGHKYRQPEHNYENLDYGDSFYISKSGLLKRPIRIQYNKGGKEITINSGALNERYIGIIVTAYILLVSLLGVFPVINKRYQRLNERLIFSGTALVLIVVFFYFF